MSASISKELKVLVNGVDTNKLLTEEIYNKIKLQTKNIGLSFINNEFVFNVDIETALEELRAVRDKELQKTDYLFLSDNSYLTSTSEKTELKAKRKKLRDATENLKTVEEVLIKIQEIKKI